MGEYDIILDTNVVFSGLKSKLGASYKLLSLIGRGSFAIHLSVPLVLEYEEKLKEKRKLLGLSTEDIDDFVDYLCSVGQRHSDVNIFWRPCLNDPDDEMILELAIHCGADYIVTHNLRDFRMVKGFKITAITPNEFLRMNREENSL